MSEEWKKPVRREYGELAELEFRVGPRGMVYKLLPSGTVYRVEDRGPWVRERNQQIVNALRRKAMRQGFGLEEEA